MSDRLLSGGLSGLSDGELTALVRQGPRRDSSPAVAELFSRHWASVYRYTGLCTRRPSAAIELVKEAFLLVQREARDSETRPFAWCPRLLATVLACARTWSTNDHRTDLSTELLAWLDEPGNAGEAEDGGPPTLARWAFAELPEQSQCLLWHSVVEGDPPADISRLTGQGEQIAARHEARVRKLFREECVQAHLTRTIDPECLTYGSLLDAATRNETADPGPQDLDRHLLGCTHCRAAAEELEQYGDRLPLILAGGMLAWGAKPYLDTRKAGGVRCEVDSPRTALRPGSPPAVLAAAAGLTAAVLIALAATVGNLGTHTNGNSASPQAGPSSRYAQPNAIAGASTAFPQPSPQVTGTQLRNASTGKCLDVRGGTPAAEADVVSARCTSAPSQQWVFGEDSLVHTATNPNLCLDTTGDGGVVLHTCDQGSSRGPRDLRLTWNTKGEIFTSTSPELALTSVPANAPDDVVLKIRDGSTDQIWLGQAPSSKEPVTKRAAPSDTPAKHTPSPRPSTKAPSPSSPRPSTKAPSPSSPQPSTPSPTPSGNVTDGGGGIFAGMDGGGGIFAGMSG
ncbi:ricin-type beta-trefoil lectin domain protein [Streptomyces sp. NPDC005728]|uniref:ricin-type beta-trefoil lectin domain protein n=1 Tax=Streptomyces sp. NPDC005728 TaxID=3157054 RepID=UPI0033E05D5F